MSQKLKPLSEVTALVVDNGLFVELAEQLSKSFKKVYYHVPWASGFPKMNNAYIGYGLNVETVLDIFGPHFDDIDLFIFPDVYSGPLQLHLESLGKVVWGARMGEEMELERDAMKQAMAKDGLPVAKWRKVHGTKELRDYLKENKNKWVKINRWRGTFETFFAKDYKSIEPKLDEVEQQLGAFKYLTDFIVEDDLPDRVEIGIDSYTVDGQLPSCILTGIEIKDCGLLGVFKDFNDIPKPVRLFDEWAQKLFKAYGYRGFYSTEVRIGKDHQPYMIDACARAASPPSELYQEFYTNLADIIWKGANGILVDPKPIAKYGAEALIHSAWADKNWQPIDFPEKHRRNIKLRNAIKINGRYYVVPQNVGLPEIGAVIGWGDTIDEAVNMVTEIAKEVSGYFVQIKTEAFKTAQEEIEKLKSFGASPFD